MAPRKRLWLGVFLVVALAAVMISTARSQPDGEAVGVTQEATALAASRSLVMTFGQTLKSQLMQAMASGGPAEAIFVCKDTAPLIASRLSRQSGAKIRRTSLRYRNAANAPEPWEADVLAAEFGVAARADNKPHEFIVSLDDGATRYMQSISAAPICLTCHGQSVPEEVSALLEAHYPYDLATGYSLHDIRGAYSVTWPAGSRVFASDKAPAP